MTADDEFLPRLRVMQIIAAAMMAGVVIFLTIVLFLANQQAGAAAAPPALLSWLMLGLLLVELPLTFLLPAAQTRAAVRQIGRETKVGETKVSGTYQELFPPL